MTVRMSFCLKAVKTLSNQDLGALTDGIESYVKAGMAAKAAERAAVTDLLEQVNGERGEVIGLLRAQHPDVFAPPPAPAPVVMNRAEPSTGMSQEDVQTVVDAVTSGWANAPEVVVLGSMADASEAAQKVDRDAKAEGADGATQGYWEAGKVYLIADQLKSDGQVVRVLFHETIGHAGLRGLFGRKLLPILDEVASANDARMQEKATQYGMDLSKPEDRLTVAEEILAEMAERTPEATLVQRAIAAVRQFLRAIGIKVALTDADIVANVLVPAREFITNGRGTVAAESRPAPASNQDIRRSVADTMREGIRGFNQTAARNLFLDITSNAGKLGFWGRTIGTQYAKAKKHPLTFGRVFDAVQDYIKDINIFGNAAADMAPTILPKLESWRDLMKGGLLRHGEATAADLKAAGSAVFQGTLSWARDAGGKLVKIDDVKAAADKLTVDAKAKVLLRGNRITEQVLKMWQGQPLDRYEKMVADKFDREFLRPGVVFTEPELRRMGFSGPQITLYNEFRAAVDQSLTDLAKTEMVRLAGGDGDAVSAQVMAAPDLATAASIINQHFNTLAAAEPDRKAGLDKTYQAIADKSTQVDRLKAEGYAPLMRFGPHTLRITRDGETLFFGMYESRREANKAAREMQADAEFNGAEFVRRKMNDEAYKLYAGLPLDALELFATTTGNANNEVYQDFLRLTKNNRSAMKRMIHRQGIAGFNEDTARVLASFVTSNARMASGNLNLGRAKKLVQEMEKTESDGDLTKDAGRLVQYVQDPQEEAPALRGLLFTQFIGGSVASAATNLTQPITMTLPYLSQFGGLAKATQHLMAAARTVAAGTQAGEIGEALKRAEDDGIVSPQEIHHLQAEAMKTLGNHPVLKKAAFIWGSLFSLSEQFNRRVTFVAAYNAAKETHNPDPFGFAEKAVIETQGLYNKGNKPNWARGPVGAVAFTFKQFSIHYLEFLDRMWRSGPQGKRAVGVALAILVLVAGAGGLPFADDLDDAIDTLAQALGYDFSSKAAKRKFVADTLGLGSVAADVATRGLTSLPGFPIDMSLRLSMGNLLPGTGALLRSNTDRSKDVLEFAGAAGGLAKNAIDAGTKLLAGDVAEAGLKLAPTAIQNMAKAMQMWNTGEYRNQREQKVMDTGPVDAAMKFIGFQPAEVARESSRMQELQRSIQLVKNVEGEIAGKWAEGLNDGDQAKVKEAQRELADWNAKNENSQMRITMRQVIQRVREMRATRQERTIKSAPREMRERVREQMQ